TVKGVVDRLRARDLVTAAPLESDKRRLMLAPTRKGRALYRKYAQQAVEVTRQTLAPLDEEEQRQLMQLLERLI
ncbi:MAG: MarR family transcriptional regulator, partial [Pseudomonadota bacterium]|nr:MarR family transcriptional regulator [Pseudomonadota bacterium]